MKTLVTKQKERLPLVLGTTDIGKYVDDILELSEGQVQKIEDRLREFGPPPNFPKALVIEKVAARELYLKQVASHYSSIDLSFLGMQEENETPAGNQIFLPRFAVFFLDEQIQTNKFSSNFYFDEENELVCGFEPNLPDEMKHHFSIKASRNIFAEIQGKKVKKEMQGRQGTITMTRGFLKATITFNGLLPSEVKKRMKDATRFPGTTFLIAEAQKEDWRWSFGEEVEKVEHFTVDPIIIKIIEGRPFLIDHFDCTPLEDVVRREFTS